jgi:hypothetical protein
MYHKSMTPQNGAYAGFSSYKNFKEVAYNKTGMTYIKHSLR